MQVVELNFMPIESSYPSTEDNKVDQLVRRASIAFRNAVSHQNLINSKNSTFFIKEFFHIGSAISYICIICSAIIVSTIILGVLLGDAIVHFGVYILKNFIKEQGIQLKDGLDINCRKYESEKINLSLENKALLFPIPLKNFLSFTSTVPVDEMQDDLAKDFGRVLREILVLETKKNNLWT